MNERHVVFSTSITNGLRERIENTNLEGIGQTFKDLHHLPVERYVELLRVLLRFVSASWDP